MADLIPYLASDGSLARIDVEDAGKVICQIPLAAPDMTTLITNLGAVRAKMADEVPRSVDTNPIWRDVTRMPGWVVSREAPPLNGLVISFRHPGFGWLAFPLAGEAIVKLMTAVAQGMQTQAPGLIVPKKPGIIT